MEMCRACLATGKDMVQMDEALVNNYNILTSLNITLTHDMPLYSCNTCFDGIKFCMEFREKCISSDITLKELILPNDTFKNNESTDHQLKQEVKVEYESDSIIFEDYYEELSNDYVNSPCLELGNDDDYVPNNNIKHLKKRVKKERKSLSKVKVEKHNTDNDDILEHCGICYKKYTNRENLVKHFEHHKLDRSCGLCPERVIDFTHLLAHRVVHVPDNEKKCHICSQRFISPDYLEFHYIKKHNFRGEDGQLLCKICLSPYLTPHKLSKHVWAVHSDIRYTCNECGKGFRVKQSLKSHMNSHNNERPYECDLCDFSCRFSGGVREHKLRKHTEGRVYCKACGRAFATQDILDKHACKHTLGVICPVCGVYVNKSSHLSRHIASHSGVHRYRCERCPAQFKSLSSYKAHNNKHDGNKPFHCEHCPMKFYSAPVLIKHRRTHTGEKPYVCKICAKGFTGNHNLKVHMRVHGQNLIVKRTTKLPVHVFE